MSAHISWDPRLGNLTTASWIVRCAQHPHWEAAFDLEAEASAAGRTHDIEYHGAFAEPVTHLLQAPHLAAGDQITLRIGDTIRHGTIRQATDVRTSGLVDLDVQWDEP
jgi:hypothetical protein